ncbi:MAG: hypothetical protein ACYDCN_15450 [Bacteroidia bacterium]
MKKKFIILLFVFYHLEIKAFWLLNFGTASTLMPGQIAFISGTGGQLTMVGDPFKTNFTPFLAHAGIRFGLCNGLDIGYRLCTVTLPYNSVGPTLGAAMDLKWRITHADSPWQMCFIAGAAYSYVSMSDQSRNAYAPGVAASLTHKIFNKATITLNARFVDTFIPSALGGAQANNLQAIGGSVGFTIPLNTSIAIMPEIGAFDFKGSIGNLKYDGLGMQYGLVLKVSLGSVKQKDLTPQS